MSLSDSGVLILVFVALSGDRSGNAGVFLSERFAGLSFFIVLDSVVFKILSRVVNDLFIVSNSVHFNLEK